MKKSFYLFFLLLLSFAGQAQNRISDHNPVGWIASFNTIRFSPKWSLLAEAQYRMVDDPLKTQQLLFRTALQYSVVDRVTVGLGYAHVDTYPYGDYPAGPHSVPEHRVYEQLSINDKVGRIGLEHRFRLEQRWMGKVDQAAADREVNGWNYLNRARYNLKLMIPLNHATMSDNTIYLAAMDEVFIGFGKNVRQNIFDQNRIQAGLGYRFNPVVRAEVCYLNQTVQQAGLVTGKPVYQYNNGIILNVFTNITVRH